MKSHLMLCKVAVNKDKSLYSYSLSGTVKIFSYIRRLAYYNVTTFADIFKGLISLVSMHANVYKLIKTASRNCIDMFTDDGAISNNCCEF